MKKRLKILIIGDSEDNTLVNIGQIKKGGYNIYYERVETAETFKSALTSKDWDIILSDYKIPHLNGLEALSMVRDSEKDIPFIIISGLIGEDIAAKAMKAGAHDYIMKDNLQRLLPAVEREIRESKDRAKQKRLAHKEKLNQEEMFGHFKFFESLDKINRAIQGTNELKQMMIDVLDTVLSIFDCDRAFLMYPCDPGSQTWRVPMERNKPEYPGVFEQGLEMKVDDFAARTFRLMLDTEGPVMFGHGTENPLPEYLKEQFQLKNYMAMAIYPKRGKPWQFGIHQCSHARIWTTNEVRLLQEIGRRLTDALSSLLLFRDLQNSMENLGSKNDLLSSVINCSSEIIIFSLDRNYCYTAFNDRHRTEMKKVWNVDIQLGMNLLNCMYLYELKELAKQSIDRALSGKAFSEIQHQPEPDIYYEFNWNPIFKNKKVIGITAFIQDITGQKQNEIQLLKLNQELKQTVRFNKALLSAIPTPVFYKDKEGRYLGCNRAFSEIMGVTSDQIKGKTVFEMWPGKHAKVYHNKDLELIKNPERQIYEFKVRDKDGLERPVIYSKDVFRDENDQVKGIVGAFIDITDRKCAEEALQKAHDEMEQHIEERTAELKKTNEQLNALYKIGQTISSPLNLKKVLDKIAQSTARLLKADTGVILLIDEKGKFLTIQGSYGLSEKVIKGTRDLIGESIAGRVVQQGGSIIANDLPNNPLFYNPKAADEGLLSCASVPMTAGGRIIGTLDIHSKKDRYAFNEEDIHVLKMLASQAAIAIENARLFEKIQLIKDELEIRVQQRTSELMAANAQLTAKEMEIRNLAESSPGLMGTYYLRPDGSVCMPYSSPQIQNLYGLHPEDVVDDATQLMERTHPDDINQVRETIAESARNMTPWRHEFRVLHPTRGELWLEGSTNPKPHPDGGTIWYGFIHDITNRKRAEAELLKYRDHLEELVKERTAELETERNKMQQYLDIAGVILVIIDADRKVTLINQKGCEVLGGKYRDIIGRDWFESFVPENIRQEVIQGFKKLLAGKMKHSEYFEHPILTLNGEERLIAWHNVLLKNDAEKVIGTLSSGEDITEKKHTETQIKKLNHDLQERALALETANKELEAFSYSVSHDLRAPLRSIDGFSQVLLEEYQEKLDEKGQNYLNRVRNAAQRMAQLIDDILKLSKVSRGKINIRNINLSRIAYEVGNELSESNPGRNVKLIIQDDILANADKQLLTIVLQNLMGNAWKFTSKHKKAIIEFGVYQQDEKAIYFVKDDGVGFDMQYAQKLFGAFQRLHSTNEFPGTGIGLATVQRIIHRHGGRIWAESAIEKGTTIYFTLI